MKLNSKHHLQVTHIAAFMDKHCPPPLASLGVDPNSLRARFQRTESGRDGEDDDEDDDGDGKRAGGGRKGGKRKNLDAFRVWRSWVRYLQKETARRDFTVNSM